MISPRRPIRLWVLVTVLLIVLYTVIHYPDILFGGVARHADGDEGSVESDGIAARSEHPVDAFIKGFPKLRGPGNHGSPHGVEARSVEGTGKSGQVIFDWPRTTKMFVL